MAKKTKKVEKNYERRIVAVITFVDGAGESMAKEEIACLLKGLLKCDDVHVKSVKVFEHEN